jgi:hypothetical protein
MIGYRIAGGCLIAAAAVCALTGCGSGGDSPSAVASTSAVAGSPVAASPGPAGASTAAADPSFGDGLATGACHTWALGMNQDSASRTMTVAAAARQANLAARHDSRWATLAKEMSFVSSLPETGNTPSDQQKAVADEQDIGGQCSSLGVTVGH